MRPLSNNGSADRLFRYLAAAYTLLIVYASLYPPANWRFARGSNPFLFLDRPWPLYWTGFDLVFNVAAYLPIGFLFALVFLPRAGRGRSLFFSVLAGAVLSVCLEALQTYLPSRFASNLDLICNTFGTLLGALLAVCRADRLIDGIAWIQSRFLVPEKTTEAGLTLIAFWLLAQFSPESPLFATGNIRAIFNLPPLVLQDTPRLFALKAAAIGCHIAATGLFVSCLLRAAQKKTRFLSLALFFGGILLLRSLATAFLTGPSRALSWFDPGLLAGCLTGLAVLLPTLGRPRARRALAASIALLAGVMLTNLLPPAKNAFVILWHPGHFLNFNGLTRLISALWPLFASIYFIGIVGTEQPPNPSLPPPPER